MRKVATYVVAALSAFIAFQAYGNATITEDTRGKATRTACGVKECSQFEPVAERSSIISHEFEFATRHGPFIVSCRRAAIFLGSWSCSQELEAGRIGLDRRY